MQNRNVGLFVMVAVGMLMVGCSSSPTMKQLAEDESRASEVRAKAAEARQAKEQERMEAAINQVPKWALEQPRPDDTGVYAVGTAESDRMRVAIKKAMLEAEFGLAQIYNQELSGSERSYTQDNNGRVGQEQFTALIDKLVSQVPVVGFEIVRQEVKPIDGKYNAFVLLKLPYAQFNSVLKDQRAATDDGTVLKAYDDLEHRLEKRRQQRIDDAARQTAPSSLTGSAVQATAQTSAQQ
ncbi:MAG: hypothetical protein WB444_13870 [Gallionella sp.]